ncbi:protein CPR-5 [Ananas comosus]|uniref:Protein CPR-5 n=1 Tax=Ananas comosus TaxID=4615 RepID=A0A6P5GWV4_ANACO|nr:protein CPR-5 [Ananas comosus]
MEFPLSRTLAPCSTHSSSKSHNPRESTAAEEAPAPAAAEEEEEEEEEGDSICGGGDTTATAEAAPPLRRSSGDAIAKAEIRRTGAASPSASSSASSSSSSSSRRSPPPRRRGVRLRRRRRALWVARGGAASDYGLGDLALPLGMSFAAVIAQVLEGLKVSEERLPPDRLSMICTSAVREAITNIYGERLDCFMRNFEKSFCSTLKTLHVIKVKSSFEHENPGCSSLLQESPLENPGCCSSSQGSPRSVPNLVTPDLNSIVEEFGENIPLNSINSQLILHGQANQQLAHTSHRRSHPKFNNHILNTFERSVKEQARTNDLKEVEIGLTMRKLRLKQSQLALSSYSHVLEKIKISMGISKASFREEKLKNQMQDTRHAEFLRRCIDLMVTGLIIMVCCLLYGAYVYSYRRITEATSACAGISKESKSWWMPKPMASFNSGWLTLKCHLVALSQMFFGVLMILVIAWLVLKRSSSSGPNMPVTFMLTLLGLSCGLTGKLCVDALGGHGYWWLLSWESLCLLHFSANVFPSAFYTMLYGPVLESQGSEAVRLPYWFRRHSFYAMLLLILPVSAGLLPFASINEWKGHFAEKVKWSRAEENML